MKRVEPGHYEQIVDGVTITVKRFWSMTMRQPGIGRGYKSTRSGWRALFGPRGPSVDRRTKREAVHWVRKNLVRNVE